MVKGELKETVEGVEFTKHVGFLEIEDVVAINPTLEERAKLFNTEVKDDAKEIEYISTDEEGNTKLRLDFYYSNSEVGIKRYSVTLINKERRNKNQDKYQYISSIGTTSWAEDESGLPEWFKKFTDKEGAVLGDKEIRVALEGEELLFIFLRAFFSGYKDNDPEKSITFNYKKLFAGDYREIRGDVFSGAGRPFVGLLQVETSDDGTKKYEKLFGKAFLPKGYVEKIANNSFRNEYEKKQYDKFLKELKGEYGARGFYTLSPVHIYNSEEDTVAGKPKEVVNNTDY